MHSKAKQNLRDQLSTHQGNGSEMALLAEATKINQKNLRTLLGLDVMMQATILRHLYIVMEDLTL